MIGRPVQGTSRGVPVRCTATQGDATGRRRDIAGRNDLSRLMLSGECDWIVSDYSQRIVTNAAFIKLDTVESASRLKLLNISCCSGSYLAFMLAL